MNASLQTALRQLRLSGMLSSLEVRLQEAAGNSLTPAELLELILQDELLVRKNRQMQRHLKAAQFPETQDAGGLRLTVQPLDQEKAGVRPGQLSLHPRSEGLPLVRAAGNGEKSSLPGPRLPGGQAGLCGALSLDLRRGAGLPGRRGLRRLGPGPDEVFVSFRQR